MAGGLLGMAGRSGRMRRASCADSSSSADALSRTASRPNQTCRRLPGNGSEPMPALTACIRNRGKSEGAQTRRLRLAAYPLLLFATPESGAQPGRTGGNAADTGENPGGIFRGIHTTAESKCGAPECQYGSKEAVCCQQGRNEAVKRDSVHEYFSCIPGKVHGPTTVAYGFPPVGVWSM